MTPQQKSKYEQLTERLPADMVPGYSVGSEPANEPQSSFLDERIKYARDMASNAYGYYNITASSKGPLSKRKRKPQRVLSSEGFPPWVKVTYVNPPPMSYKSPNEVRTVDHIVFHSFGHTWHASYNESAKEVGWMNAEGQQKGVVPVSYGDSTVYIAKGSDPESMAHFDRFSSGLQASLHSAAKASAHFLIDRNGNLTVVGDCNDIVYASESLQDTSCSIELEEAFYVLKDTKGQGNKATWQKGGDPPGTSGTIEYFAYSAPQLLTLSVLCAKLEAVYTAVKGRNLQLESPVMTVDSPPGYTMHGLIKGAKHIDVSPHFLSQDLWDAFFALVDTHTHITPVKVFRPAQKWPDSDRSMVVDALSDVPVTAMTDRLLHASKVESLASMRASQLANSTRSSTNNNAAEQAVQESKFLLQQTAVSTQLMQQTQDPQLDLASDEQPSGSDGLQVGSDDWF